MPKCAKMSASKDWRNIQRERFAVEYANTPDKPLKYWAKRYKKTERTIRRWLQDKQVRQIIEKSHNEIRKELNEIIIEYAREALHELAKIMRMKKKNETKRKACNDLLGLANIENINIEGKSNVSINIDYSKLTDEQLTELLQRKLIKEDKNP